MSLVRKFEMHITYICRQVMGGSIFVFAVHWKRLDTGALGLDGIFIRQWSDTPALVLFDLRLDRPDGFTPRIISSISGCSWWMMVLD